MFKNLLRQVRVVIYRLKRQYGLPMTIKYMDTEDIYNLRTGEVARDLVEITIKRGILLPERQSVDYMYDLSFIAANKNFTYGGFFEPGERAVIVDVKDLPTAFKITTEMYVVFQSRRFEIKEAHKIPDHIASGYAWLLKVKEVSATEDDV